MATTVLVTGAGALLGQGILRSLRLSSLDLRILTADPDSRSSGHWLGTKAFQLRLAKDPEFLGVLESILASEKVDFLFVGTDAELPLIADHRERLESLYGCKVVVSSPTVVQIADDKWLTAEFLRTNGLPYPRSARADHSEEVEALVKEVGFPLLAKPRIGARSVGVEIVRSQYRCDEIVKSHPDFVFQEVLPDSEGEHTAGCVVTDGVCRAVVNLRRDLRDGNTYRAYRDERSSCFDAQLSQIAEALGAEGPVNFQFRVREGEPVIFEINGRFSGTTPMRTIFGFNEVDALLRYYVLGEPIQQPVLRSGIVLKVWSDIFVPAEEVSAISQKGFLDQPSSESLGFIPHV